MNFEELTIEDETNLIENNLFQDHYNQLFKEDYESSSFDYNGIKVRYLKKLETYITDRIIKQNKSNIKKEIIELAKIFIAKPIKINFVIENLENPLNAITIVATTNAPIKPKSE